jgi:hypothetical protein
MFTQKQIHTVSEKLNNNGIWNFSSGWAGTVSTGNLLWGRSLREVQEIFFFWAVKGVRGSPYRTVWRKPRTLPYGENPVSYCTAKTPYRSNTGYPYIPLAFFSAYCTSKNTKMSCIAYIRMDRKPLP